jgi:hypothetical protein
MRRAIPSVLGWLALPCAFAQAQAQAEGEVVGLVLLYLVLVAVGLIGLALRPTRTQSHIRAIREGANRLFWRGLGITVPALLIVLVMGALSESLKRAGETQGAQIAGLVALLVLIAYGILALLGLGSVAVVVGDRVAQLFGWRDLAAGWCIMLGVATILLIVWIPVFGWALGIYWLALMVAGISLRGSPEIEGAD